MGRSWLARCVVLAGAMLVAACSTKDDEAGGGDSRAPDAASETSTAGLEVIVFDALDEAPDAVADTVEDAAPPAPAGEACTDGSQCASGWCVPSAIGVVCVDLCLDACPEDHVCAPASTETATDPVFLCVPIASPDDPTGGDDVDASASEVLADALEPDVGVDQDGVTADGVGPGDADAATSGEVDGGGVSDNDQDGDGIPDDQDNIPCLGFTLTVYNEGVTSGSLALNGTEVVSPSSFPTDAPIVVPLNPVVGENNLAITGKLTGSPSDSLTLVIQDSTGRMWFYVVVVRSHGAPREESFTFTIDVDCDELALPQ